MSEARSSEGRDIADRFSDESQTVDETRSNTEGNSAGLSVRFLLGGVITAAGALFCIGLLLKPQSASAVPSFAMQTGQPCSACHTAFPELTPYGREFKLMGYTAGGGLGFPKRRRSRRWWCPHSRIQSRTRILLRHPIPTRTTIRSSSRQACSMEARSMAILARLFRGHTTGRRSMSFSTIRTSATRTRPKSSALISSMAWTSITIRPFRMCGIRRRPGASLIWRPPSHRNSDRLPR